MKTKPKTQCRLHGITVKMNGNDSVSCFALPCSSHTPYSGYSDSVYQFFSVSFTYITGCYKGQVNKIPSKEHST